MRMLTETIDRSTDTVQFVFEVTLYPRDTEILLWILGNYSMLSGLQLDIQVNEYGSATLKTPSVEFANQIRAKWGIK